MNMIEQYLADMTTAEEIEQLLIQGPPYLSSSKPFLTVSDIAEELNVSKETIRNNIGNAQKNPLIHRESVGQAQVFWCGFESEEKWDDDLEGKDIGELVEQYVETEREKLHLTRALWLQTGQELIETPGGRFPPDFREKAWSRLINYHEQIHDTGTVSFRGALSRKSIPSEYRESVDVNKYATADEPLPEGFRYLKPFLYDAPLFDSPLGVEIEGIVMLYVHELWMRKQLDGEKTKEERDEILPSAKDIYHAGNVVDRFAVQLYDYDW